MTTVIAHHFGPPEVAALERDAVDLAAISPSLLVAFPAKRLERARLAWLNVRWFLQRGIDVLDPPTRQRTEAWLMDEFAFEAAPSQGAFANTVKTFYADRYGSTEATTPHGGSGRSGIAGRFSVKGIGRTPLVGEGAHAGHAHGHASLEECLREAVYSELFDAEFPAGALPVIAVLDTGRDYVDPDLHPARAVRAGLLIRPCALRPAHVERAPLFRPVGATESEVRDHQAHDVARAKAAIRHWLAIDPNGDPAACIKQLIARLVAQIAFGQVHRLTGGGVFSSNVSIRGELLDFGNAHYLPDWRRAKVLDHAAGFGDELTTLRAVIRSLVFYFNKYGCTATGPLHEDEWQKYAVVSHQEAFTRECARLFNAQRLSSALALPLITRFRTHFKEQQRQRVRYQFGHMVGQGPGDAASEFFSHHQPSLAPLIAAAFRGVPNAQRHVAGACTTLRRYLHPRTDLDRGHLVEVFDLRNLADSTQDIAPRLEAAISGIVGGSRRHWPMLPDHLVIRAQKTDGVSCALLCDDVATGGQALWLEGIHHADRLCLFDHWLAHGAQRFASFTRASKKWGAMICLADLGPGSVAEDITALIDATPGTFITFQDEVRPVASGLLEMAAATGDKVSRSVA